MSTKARSGYLPTLDGWRAIAILAVLLDHSVAYSRLQSFPGLFAATRTGPNGVSLFFAISGFLICSRLLEEQHAFGHISLKGFYIRRACRILPPAMLYLVIIGALGVAGVIVVSSAEWWSSVFFFRNYLPGSWISHGWGGYTIHYWSLAVEEHFYLLWPAVLVLLGIVRARKFAIGLAIAIACWRMLDFHQHFFDRLIPGLLFGSRTDVRLDALLLGCLAALLLDDGAIRQAFSQYFNEWVWWGCVALYVVIQFTQRVRTYSLMESVLLPVIVAGTVYRPEMRIDGLLESRAFKIVGRLSYSLYLWQQLFLVPQPGSKLRILQGPPIGILMVFLMAWLSYQLVERPFIRVGHRLAPPPTEGRGDLSTNRATRSAAVPEFVAESTTEGAA